MTKKFSKTVKQNASGTRARSEWKPCYIIEVFRSSLAHWCHFLDQRRHSCQLSPWMVYSWVISRTFSVSWLALCVPKKAAIIERNKVFSSLSNPSFFSFGNATLIHNQAKQGNGYRWPNIALGWPVYYCRCPPARVLGSRVSGLVFFCSVLSWILITPPWFF